MAHCPPLRRRRRPVSLKVNGSHSLTVVSLIAVPQLTESVVSDGGNLQAAGASGEHDTRQPHAMAPGLVARTIEQRMRLARADANTPAAECG